MAFPEGPSGPEQTKPFEGRDFGEAPLPGVGEESGSWVPPGTGQHAPWAGGPQPTHHQSWTSPNAWPPQVAWPSAGAPEQAPSQPPKPRFSVATVLTSLLLSILVGGLAGAVAGSRAERARPTPVSIPQAGPVALPEGASIADLVRAVEPGVATVHVFSGAQRGAGTGFLIDKDGHIVTNRHVIEGAREYRINLAGKKDLRARLVGADRELDIAVLQIDPFPDMKPLTLGNSDHLRVGDTVIAVGNALDLPGGPTVTMGIVSALNRSLSDETPGGRRIVLTGLIQTDAAINPGNSGGPLLNLAGQVVGVNTAVAANPNDITGSQQAQNIGFAININDAKVAAENVINGVVSRRAILGVDVVTVTPVVAERRGLAVDEGALVADLMPGGPAEAAGLQVDDVIVAVDGKKVTSAEELRAALRPKNPGDEVGVEFYRGQEKKAVRVKLGEAP
ncbi:MAG: protease DO family protein [Acidimicrobiia bacterium]